ncbi:MAG: hypothetical protein ACK4ZJ_17015, partial [Allorhizobium sp.]
MPNRGSAHAQVKTAGPGQKFGLPLPQLPTFAEEAARLGITVIGLHAHVGSGVRDADAWNANGRALAGACPAASRRTAAHALTLARGPVLPELVRMVPSVRWIDIGGGLGVV